MQGGPQPQVTLNRQPILTFRTGNLCGLKGNVTGAAINVVNLVQYDLRNLNNNSNLGGQNQAYAPLYGDPATAAWDADRTELVRVELDTSGTPIAGTEELIAEYAVDFELGITVVNGVVLNGTDPDLFAFAPGDAQIENWAGDSTLIGNPLQGPQRVRTVRLRLSVRSREPDRQAPIVGAPTTLVAPGLYRIALGGNGTGAPYARVRTLQAEVALHNQVGHLW